jgi:hypothetical protein
VNLDQVIAITMVTLKEIFNQYPNKRSGIPYNAVGNRNVLDFEK